MIYIIFFFTSLFVSLWFGEARQGSIELFWTTAVLVFFLFSLGTHPKKTPFLSVPHTYGFLFLATLIPIGISTFYSSSPAYSLSFLLRMLSAWCIFFLVYTIPKKETTLPAYATGLVYLGTLISLLSLGFRFFPHLVHLPVMNLLYSQTGHNQAVAILLTLFPLSFHYGMQYKNKKGRWIPFFLFSIAILFCFSRAAIIIAGIYLLVETKKKNTTQQTWIHSLVVGFLSVVVLIMCASMVLPIQEVAKKLPFKMDQIVKSNISEEVRLSNWTQAIRGFVSHPLLGTGPNTYILTSMHYHTKTNDGAGLAHNWYLQTLSEVGLLGAIPIGYILYRVLKTLLKTRKTTKNGAWATIGLVDSVLIAFVYSLIDYNLDYFTLWMLLWGTVAIVLPQKTKPGNTLLSQSITIGAVVILSAYVGTNLYANTWLNTVETVSQRFLLQPYDTNRTARYIEYKNIKNEPLTKKEQSLIRFWHKDNPDVLIILATAQNIIPPDKRNEFYTTALAFNPLNSYYYQSYLTFLYEQGQTEDMYAVFTTFIDNAYHVTNPSAPPITQKLPKDVVLPAVTPELFSLFSGTANVPEIASKTLYIIGFSSLSTAPTATETLWTIAKDISPDWGLFHRELASYYMYIAKDSLQAKLTLIDCQMRGSPAKACKQELELFPKISEPGSYKENILLIPSY